jgi:membrane protease YdiL (CAAX protease family)
LHLIDEFRLSPGDEFRGGYLFVFLAFSLFLTLAVFYPPGPGVTSWTELHRRLVCGLPCLALFILPSVDPVRKWLKEKWSYRWSGAIFTAIAGVAMAVYFYMVGPWPSVMDFAIALAALYLPFPVLRIIKSRSSIWAGWIGMVIYMLLLLKPPLSMLLISPAGHDLRLDFNLWFVLCLAGAVLLFEHQLGMEVRYTYKMRGSDGLWVLAAMVALVFFVILPARWMGFSDVVLHIRPLVGIVAAFFAKTWFVAVSQEYIFRAVAVNSLPQTGDWWTGKKGTIVVLTITSFWFGIVHYDLGGVKYVLLATIAGYVYGYLYLKTGRLSTPVIAHGILDTIKYLFG